MKKKLLLMLVVIAVLVGAMFTLALSASAEEENITVSFMTGINSTSLDKSVATNGVLTVGKGQEFTLPTKTVEFGSVLVWATPEGQAWEAGQTVSFDKDTVLYQFTAHEVSSIDSLKAAVGENKSVKLMCDIESTSTINTTNGSIVNFYMNGYTLKISKTNNGFGSERSGRRFYGDGKIVFEPNSTTGTGAYVFQMHSHGYNGHNNYLLLGKNITVEAPNAILGCDTNGGTTGYPKMDIYGKVTAYEIMHLNGGDDRKPYLNIYDGAEIKLTGPSLTGVGSYKGIVNVNISGGTFVIDADGAKAFSVNANPNNSNAELNVFTITGGSFVLNDADLSALKGILGETASVTVNELNSTSYNTVIYKTECAHNYTKVTFPATCSDPVQEVYTCSLCGNSYVIEYGEKNAHNFEQTGDIPATPTQLGTKIYTCTRCGKVDKKNYSYDPSMVNITVVVNTADGEKTVSVAVTDVFELEASGSSGAYSYTIVGIKDFDAYVAADVIEVNIPACIAEVNFKSDAIGLKVINIDDGTTVVITSFKVLTALETFNIGAATVTFKSNCSNDVIKNIFSDKEGAYVNYETKAFSNKQSLEKVTFSTNSDYVLAGECFGDCRGIKKIILPDYSRPQFTGSAFWQNNIEYIYVGRGIYSLTNDPFNRNYKLKTAVLMDVNSFPNGWTFCYSYDWANDNDPSTGPAEIYIHSTTLNLANDAFYQSHGITVYTNAPITHSSAFSGCQSKTVDGVTYPAYTIVYGIPHKYVEGYKAPTCTEEGANGYVTDCPCGQQLEGTVEAKKFVAQKTNSSNYETIVYTSTPIPALGHDILGGTISVSYESFLEKGSGTFVCLACGVTHNKENAATPLFVFRGYSVKEDGTAFCVDYGIDVNAINEYARVNNSTVTVGLFAASAEKLGSLKPHEAVANGNVPVVNAEIDLAVEKLVGLTLKIRGFDTDELKNTAIVMSAYLKETKTVESVEQTTVAYMQGTQIDSPSAYSMAQYLIDTAA